MSDPRTAPRAEGPAAPPEPRYDADYLVEHARALLGAEGPTVRGALVGQQKSSLTIQEARSALREFLRRPVQHAHGGEVVSR